MTERFRISVEVAVSGRSPDVARTGAGCRTLPARANAS